MSYQKKSQKVFLSYIMVILWLFIITLWLLPSYQTLISQLDQKTLKDSELQALNVRSQELQDIYSKIQSGDNLNSEIISLYSKEFHEYKIFEYIHEYARNVSWNTILIRDITFSSPSESDIWFQKTDISLSVVVPNEDALMSLLDYLISEDNEYVFFIPSFNYALGEISWNFIAQIPLTLYHR